MEDSKGAWGILYHLPGVQTSLSPWDSLCWSFSLWGGSKQTAYLPRDESLSLWRSWPLLRDQSHIQQGKHLPGPEYLPFPFSPASSALPVLRTF